MSPIRLKIVTGEGAQPVAVQIDYADWLEIQRLLSLRPDADATAAKAVGPDASGTSNGRYPLRGSIVRYEDPFGSAIEEDNWDALR